jgi:hypothetical protein
MTRTTFDLSIETQDLLRYMRQSMEVGKVWTYEELDDAAKCDVRAKSCLNTARRRLERDDGVVTAAVRGVGLKVLSDSEAILSTSSDLRSIMRKAKRATYRISTVDYDDLSEEGKLAHNAKMTQLLFVTHAAKDDAARRIEGAVEKAKSRLPINETVKLFLNGKKDDTGGAEP